MRKQNKDKTKQAVVKARPDPITRSGLKRPNTKTIQEHMTTQTNNVYTAV